MITRLVIATILCFAMLGCQSADKTEVQQAFLQRDKAIYQLGLAILELQKDKYGTAPKVKGKK